MKDDVFRLVQSGKSGKAELAALAPTPEELAWWSGELARHKWRTVLVSAGPWMLAPVGALFFRQRLSLGEFGEALWSAAVMSCVFGWWAWHYAGPKIAAREIRARRLRRALLSPADPESGIAEREPIRLGSRTDA